MNTLTAQHIQPKNQLQDYLLRSIEHNPLVIANGPAGVGKALEVSTPVLTPRGFTPIGELTVGSVICDLNGDPQKVTGVFPQEPGPTWTVRMRDGRTLEACDNHLWRVYSGLWSGGKILKTSELRALKKERVPVYLETYNPQVDPVSLTRVRGILEHTARPNKNHRAVNVKLFHEEQVRELQYHIWKLGGICQVFRDRMVKNLWQATIVYRRPRDLFVNPRWHHLLDEEVVVRHYVKSVTPASEKASTVCIAVDSPDRLFIAGDYLVTHNTYIAVNAALNCVAKGQQKTLILSRSNIPTGRSLGSFPGTVEEKLTPWLLPMTSQLVSRVGKGHYEYMLRKGRVQFQPLETIRGASFEDSIILVDEAQNLTYEEIKSITTRIGENSKMVLMGDPMQSDVRNSGLERLKEIAFRQSLNIPVITFTVDHIVRSDIVADLVKAYLRDEERLDI